MGRASTIYELTVEGQLGNRWQDWFEGMTLTYGQVGETILTCALSDQAALYGVLIKMRDLGLTLVSVKRVRPE